ncbi:MAG TPA: Ku protein [Acidimicrobiales bacterium]|nr:Ku protein [Acidimicrobiales bacterium]
MAPRAIWSGSISFGLVNVPVKLYSAVKQKDLHFNQLEESTGAHIKYKRVSEKTGKEVEYDRIVKGFEVSKGRYVTITAEELASVAPRASRTVDIEGFVQIDEIDPIYFENTYFLAPAGEGAAKAYGLLLKGMESTSKIAIGRFVMRTKEYLCAIRPYEGALALNTMLFPDEVVDKREVPDIPDRRASVADKELKIATSLIESLSTAFKPSAYKNSYRAQVLEMIDAKAKGEEIVAPEEPDEQAEIVDLLAALEASVEAAKKAKAKAKTRAPKSKKPTRKAS